MNICVFGDSIAWGAFDPDGGGWVGRLRNYFESNDSPPYFRDGGDVTVFNLGIPGNTSFDLLERIDAEAGARQPDVVIISIGINDSRLISNANKPEVSEQQYKDNLNKMLSVVKKHAKSTIFVGLTSVDESKTAPVGWKPEVSYRNASISRYNDILEQFCLSNDVKYIPLTDLSDSDLFDGLHPNSAGHKKIYTKVLAELSSSLLDISS